MKSFLKQCFLLVVLAVPVVVSAKKEKSEKSFYEVTVYHFATDTQSSLIEGYIEKDLLPALHRQGLSAGIFKPIANDTAVDKTLYVIVSHKSLKAVLNDQKKVTADTTMAYAPYVDAGYTAAPFARKEVMLAEAFPMAPMLTLPKLTAPKNDRVYEFRSYESATEKIYHNKVHMFNEGGEVTLFSRLNFNAIFYAAVISGSRMPNLIYMTSFENMNDRNEHWKTFSADPEWKRLSSLPEYQHNVSKADIILMKALPFSDY
ncbi:hypothetical protein BH10BAC3_BH10BAC3_41590 [soil metagenome]